MSSHIVIPTETGQVYATGTNSNGQLSLGTLTQTNTFSYAKFDASTNISGIAQSSVGSSHTLLLRTTGTVYSSGANTNGQLGLGTTTDTSFAQIVLSSSSAMLANATAVAAGASHSLFLLSDGSALSCGLNTSNQLGDGTVTQRTFPVNVLKSAGTFLDPVNSLSAGTSHSIFAANNGTAWTCGLNANGQIGDGTFTTRAYATQVRTGVSTFLSNVTQVAAGDLHSLALTASGSVFAWGRNNSGQLALGTTTDTSYATQCLYNVGVPMTSIVAISTHSNHSLFLTSGGTVYSCGLNGSGQLGDGTLTARSYPVIVSTAAGQQLKDIVSIATTLNASYFVRADGTIFACGYGSGGGFGNGSLTDASYAIQILAPVLSSAKSSGYSASYWKAQGRTASSLAAGGFGAYDLANAGFNKTDLSNAGFTIANLSGLGNQKLFSAGFSYTEILNNTNNMLGKIGQYTVSSSKTGTLMAGALLDAPKSVVFTARDSSSITVSITPPTLTTGLTGYIVEAAPVSGGSTVIKSLGLAGTLIDGLTAGTPYTLRVRCVNANGNSAANVLQNNTNFILPTLTAGSITTSGMTITFSSALATQDCSYVLRTVPNVTQYVLSAGATTQVLSGLTHSTTYTIYLDVSNAYTTNSVNVDASTNPIIQVNGFVDLYSSLSLHYRFDTVDLSTNNVSVFNSAPNKLIFDGTKLGSVGGINTNVKKFGTGSYDLSNNATGGNASCFQLPAVTLRTNTGASSVSFWINYKTIGTLVSFIHCFGVNSNFDINNSYSLLKSQGTSAYGNDKFFIKSTDGQNKFSPNAYAMTANTWYHIVWIFGRATVNEQLYVNNVLDASWSGCDPVAQDYNFNVLGRSNGESVQGYFDDYRFYNNKVLTTAEITHLYNMGNSTASFNTISVTYSAGNTVVSWTGTNISYVGVCQQNTGYAHKITTSGSSVPISTGNKVFVVPYDSLDRAGMASRFFSV